MLPKHRNYFYIATILLILVVLFYFKKTKEKENISTSTAPDGNIISLSCGSQKTNIITAKYDNNDITDKLQKWVDNNPNGHLTVSKNMLPGLTCSNTPCSLNVSYQCI